MRIGICGGTFDPFHNGHLAPILDIRADFGWDRVVFVPAWVQPFKRERITASAYHRFAMAVLATADDARLHVSSWELERESLSYSIETLRHLRAEHPYAQLEWIIGGDNLPRLLEWKQLDAIFGIANFVVLSREGSDAVPASLQQRVAATSTRPAHGAIVFGGNAEVPVSSTQIRLRVSAGETIDGMVDPRVSRYIHHYGLYRKGHL
jgi:nicotinate-nucleotide adenylyltransferase